MAVALFAAALISLEASIGAGPPLSVYPLPEKAEPVDDDEEECLRTVSSRTLITMESLDSKRRWQ